MDTPNKSEAEQIDPNDAFGPPDEDDAADVAEPPKQAKPTPKKQEHLIPSPALRRAAKALGFTDDMIDEANPEQLQETVAEIVADRERERRQQPEPAKPVEEDDDDALESLDKELQLDPRLKKILKKQIADAKQSSKLAVELKAALADRDTREQNRVLRASADAVEDAISGLGEDFAAILGEGTLSSLKKDSDEAHARKAIYAAAGIDVANDSPATVQRKYAKAAKKLFGKFIGKKPAPKEEEEEAEPTYQAPPKKPAKKRDGPDLGLDGNVDINEDVYTARPTQRKIAEKKGDKAAAEAIRGFVQANGWPGTNGSRDTFEGVPE